MVSFGKIGVCLLVGGSLMACGGGGTPTPSVEPGLIEGMTFNETLLIDGHDFDGTILRNCTFENIDGDGLQIRDVDNLVVENCVFRNISEDAIRFRNSGVSSGVQILNNEITDIEENGILAPEGHVNALITGNTIRNVGLDNSSALIGRPHHGIYWQGVNVTITENEIHGVSNLDGNCISIRTYGTIARNLLSGATDHGVSYFSDHPGEDGLLLIENNIAYNMGMRGVYLASNGKSENHIGSAVIRFNTLVSDDIAVVGTNTSLDDISLRVEGNILIRTDGKEPFVFTDLAFRDQLNLKASEDIGFVDATNGDFHLMATSEAVGFAEGLVDFPVDDVDGESREAVGLDAGADERE